MIKDLDKAVDLDLQGMALAAQRASNAIVQAVHDLTNFKADNEDQLGSRPNNVVAAEMAVRSRLQLEWNELIARAETEKDKKVFLRSNGVPTNDDARAVALSDALDHDSAYNLAIEKARETRVTMSDMEQAIGEAERLYQLTVLIWKSKIILMQLASGVPGSETGKVDLELL
jgi:hypothetical protein